MGSVTLRRRSRIKAREPRVATWIPLLGVGVLDVLFGIFVPLGVERATITPGIAPGFRLDFIDWSHSLAMSIVWSVGFAAIFLRKGKIVSVCVGLAVFSHFVLDLLMHPGDLALWPQASAHVGLGIWTRLPRDWWFFELGFIALRGSYYFARARSEKNCGGRAWAAIAVVASLHLGNAPWWH